MGDVSVNACAQALIDALRAAGVARLIVQFTIGEETVLERPERPELYEQVDHHAGGYLFEPIEVEGEKLAAIEIAASALVAARYVDTQASGTLLVDEEDRVWSEGVHEEAVKSKGLRVEL